MFKFTSLCCRMAALTLLCFVFLQTTQAQNCQSQNHAHTGNCSVNASPQAITLTQADGSTLTSFQFGNAAVHYLQTADGYVVLQNDNNYYYALASNSGNLRPSNVLAKDAAERTSSELNFLANIATELRYDDAVVERKITDYQAQQGTQSRIDGAFPASGTNRALMLLIDFPDQVSTHTTAEIDSLCNAEDYTVNGATGSFRKYYEDISYDNLTVNTDIAGWYRAAQPKAYYDGANAVGTVRQLIRAAVDAAETAGIDFSLYDNDDDGSVDNLFIIHSGMGQEQSGVDADIWSHKSNLWTSAVTYDGVLVNDYIIQAERAPNSIAGIGILCHEFGHAVGLPDLYDYDASSHGLATWCLMSGGTWNNGGRTPSHMNAWCKEQLEWTVPTVLTGQGSVNNMVNVTDNSATYRINTSDATEYFLISNRQQTGWDAHLSGSGMMIWHINTDAPGNQDETQPRVSLQQADGLQELQNKTGWSDNSDPYPGTTNNTTFDGTSVPNSNNHNGDATLVSLTNIAENGLLVSFNYSTTANPCSPLIDADGDGYCSDIDCDDTDATIYPDAPCNDGNASTSGDVYDEDCECAGTVVITVCEVHTISDTDFESGYDIWNDGGSDCRKNVNDAAYAVSGTRCIRLRDNDVSSVLMSDVLDLSADEELSVYFTYYVRSFENTEDFFFEISADGGATFELVEEWSLGDEFNNDERKYGEVYLEGPFSATTVVRFRCDASGNADWVYLDDIEMYGCANQTAPGQNAPAAPIAELENEVLRVYPNPVVNQLTVETTATELYVFNSVGKRMAQVSVAKDAVSVTLDFSDFPTGIYFVKGGNEVVRVVRQ